MSSLGILCKAPPGDEASWQAFVLAHFLRHETYRAAIRGQITQAKIDNITVNVQDWMLDHDEEHLDICNNLGIAHNPYLSSTDLTDNSLYDQWMYQHWLEHQQFDATLGL